MTNTTLTDTQRLTLEHAIDHAAGRIEWFPDHIKGAVRNKVLAGLRARGLALQSGDAWRVSAAAHGVLGRECQQDELAGTSKQARVIHLLRRPEGATMQEICDATGWIAHTVRGLFSGTLRKRLGLNVAFEMRDDGSRVYRIVEVPEHKGKRRKVQAR